MPKISEYSALKKKKEREKERTFFCNTSTLQDKVFSRQTYQEHRENLTSFVLAYGCISGHKLFKIVKP